MVDVDKSVKARYIKGEEKFEILVDCDKALDFKTGKDVAIEDVLATQDIYSDTRAAKLASENELLQVFETQDPLKVAEIILKKGEIQLTAEHKRKLIEEKRKRIIDLIKRNTINPQTETPHPPERINDAMNEAKVRVDEFLPAEQQMENIVRKISAIIPIKIEMREISITIPVEFAGKAYSPLKQIGKILKDEWKNDGSVELILKIPAGLQEELINTANKITQGHAEFIILKKK